jgi:hypothetical protein
MVVVMMMAVGAAYLIEDSPGLTLGRLSRARASVLMTGAYKMNEHNHV